MRQLTSSELNLWHHFTSSILTATPNFSPRFIKPSALLPRKLDLHGKTLQAAFTKVRDTLNAAKASGITRMLIITGESGEISREFEFWIETIGGGWTVTPDKNRGCWTVKSGGSIRNRVHKLDA